MVAIPSGLRRESNSEARSDLSETASIRSVTPDWCVITDILSAMRDVLNLDVPHPDEFWFATVADGFVVEDPDVADDHARTYASEANWDLIGAVMTDVSRQLLEATGEEAEISFELPDSRADLDVILDWFSLAERVAGDPGELVNGRHRLWKTWRVTPDAVLPIRSAVRATSREEPPTANDIEMVFGEAPETLWTRNPRQRGWFEGKRNE